MPLLGGGLEETKLIFKSGQIIDTINWKIRPPFDSILLIKRERIIEKIYTSEDRIIKKYPNTLEKICSVKYDSLGIKDGIVPYFLDDNIYMYKLFVNNELETLIRVNKNIPRAILTFKNNVKLFSSFNAEGKKNFTKLTYSAYKIEIVLYYLGGPNIKSLSYRESGKEVVSFDYDDDGMVSKISDGEYQFNLKE